MSIHSNHAIDEAHAPYSQSNLRLKSKFEYWLITSFSCISTCNFYTGLDIVKMFDLVNFRQVMMESLKWTFELSLRLPLVIPGLDYGDIGLENLR